MTPSEIADWLDAYQERINTSTRTFAQAAATIRAQAEALKIATEALEGIIDAYDGRERIARRALARIREV